MNGEFNPFHAKERAEAEWYNSHPEEAAKHDAFMEIYNSLNYREVDVSGDGIPDGYQFYNADGMPTNYVSYEEMSQINDMTRELYAVPGYEPADDEYHSFDTWEQAKE